MLLEYSCCSCKNQRTLGLSFLKEIFDEFPSICLNQDVFEGCLDLLSALVETNDRFYDSLSHNISLPTSGRTLETLPDENVRQQLTIRMAEAATKMITCGVILTDKPHV